MSNRPKWMPGLELRNANGNVDVGGLGFQYAIDTLTYIKERVSEQRFYTIPFAEFIPVEVGEGRFSEDIVTNLTFDVAGDFEEGNIDTGSGHSKIAEVDTAIAPITVPVVTWAKGLRYTIVEIGKALAASKWDIVEAKMKSLKRNWDLGLQEIAFLGSRSNSLVEGLLTGTVINIDTSTIPENISGMTDTEFQLLVETILTAYYDNSDNTVLPDCFAMPTNDYLGLGSAASATFPNITKAKYLEMVFKEMTGNEDFRIYPVTYAQKNRNIGRVSTNGTQRYTLYRKDVESLRMDIPVDYTQTDPDTNNNFQWDAAAYGQYTGVGFYRPLEVLYFDHSTA